MLFNFDFMIFVFAIFVIVSSFICNLYFIYPTLSKRFKLVLIRLSSIGTVSTQVASTVVELSDEELNSLLEVVFREIGSSNEITVSLLYSFGLYTPTVVNYLKHLGYIIVT
jgi:hypothetical protein